MADDTIHDEESESVSSPTIDLAKLGRNLRGARIIAGYPTGPGFVAQIKRVSGIEMTDNVLYNIENGVKNVELGEVLAIVASLGLQDAWDTYVIPAVKPEVAEALIRLRPRH